MKNLLSFILLFSTVFAFSQDKKVNFSIEATVGRSGSWHNDEDLSPIDDFPIFADCGKGALSYDFGGIINFPLGKKMTFSTGIKVIYFRTKLAKKDYGTGLIQDSNGNFIEDQKIEAEGKYSRFDFEIPLRVNVPLFKNISLSLSQSPTFNRSYGYLTTSNSPHWSDTFLIAEENIESRKLNVNTQIGFIWKQGSRFYLFPNVRFQNLGRYKEPASTRRDVILGLTGGISL